jgi:arylsulfatase A-like enzyme
LKPIRALLLAVALAALSSCSGQTDSSSLTSTQLPLPAPVESTGPARRVILISIDGLRPDAMTSAPARTLLAQLREGTHCPEAETIEHSETLPSHTSMLTGLEEHRHRVTWNDYQPGHLALPTLLSMGRKAGYSTALLCAKDKFAYLAPPEGVNWWLGPHSGGRTATADELAAAFEKTWPTQRYQLTFVHFGDADAAGHSSGWMSDPYLEAVRRIDRAIQTIIDTLRRSGVYESTALLFTADHGGHDRNHYTAGKTSRVEDRTIPWICVGPNVPKGMTLQQTVKTTDTAPTVLRFLGLKSEGPLDGTAVEEVFRSP